MLLLRSVSFLTLLHALSQHFLVQLLQLLLLLLLEDLQLLLLFLSICFSQFLSSSRQQPVTVLLHL